jgi:hypothetical protein
MLARAGVEHRWSRTAVTGREISQDRAESDRVRHADGASRSDGDLREAVVGGSMAQTKCAHPQCSCKVKNGSAFGKYCSEHCMLAGDEVTEVFCECHHPGCRTAQP